MNREAKRAYTPSLTINEMKVVGLRAGGFYKPSYREVTEQMEGGSKDHTKSKRTVKKYERRALRKLMPKGV